MSPRFQAVFDKFDKHTQLFREDLEQRQNQKYNQQFYEYLYARSVNDYYHMLFVMVISCFTIGLSLLTILVPYG